MDMFSGMMIPIAEYASYLNNIHWQRLDLLSSSSHHDYSHNMHILCQLPLSHFRVIDLLRDFIPPNARKIGIRHSKSANGSLVLMAPFNSSNVAEIHDVYDANNNNNNLQARRSLSGAAVFNFIPLLGRLCLSENYLYSRYSFQKEHWACRVVQSEKTCDSETSLLSSVSTLISKHTHSEI